MKKGELHIYITKPKYNGKCIFCGYQYSRLPFACMACIYKRWWLYPLRVFEYVSLLTSHKSK